MRNFRLSSDEAMARRAGVASFVGTTIEWYDFYLYSTASALIFGPLFFSSLPTKLALAASFTTFWAGFLARPIGGIFFGHFGDRVGRKKALITTLLMMGLATTGIGLLPTYGTAGWVGPIGLVVMRLIQGFAAGGEWGGAVLIAAEHAKPSRRILFAAFAQQGSPAGQVLSLAAFGLATQLPHDMFLSWGWRVPFLISAVLIVVGFIIRMKIAESPAIEVLRETNNLSRRPLWDVLRSQKKLMALGMCATVISISSIYLKNTFVLSWATTDLHFKTTTFITILTISSVVQFVVQPFGAVMASIWDLKKTVTIVLLALIVSLPVMFAMIGTGKYYWALLGMCIGTIPQGLYYAIVAGLLANAFSARTSYTAVSLSYQLTAAIFGTTPLISTFLLDSTGSIVSVACFGVLTGVVSLFGARALVNASASTERVPAVGPLREPAL